jgi:hypothetical protein
MATEYERPTEYRSRTEERCYRRMSSTLGWIVAAFAFFAIAALVIIEFVDRTPNAPSISTSSNVPTRDRTVPRVPVTPDPQPRTK